MSSDAWIAIRGRPLADVLKDLSLEATCQKDDFAYNDIIGGTTKSGWLVVADNDGVTAILDEGFAQKLSQGGEAVLYYGSLTTMGSFASHHRNGALVWSYSHQMNFDNAQIIVGTPGPELLSLREPLEKRQRVEKQNVDHLWSTSQKWARHAIQFEPERLFVEPIRGVEFEVMRYIGPPRLDPLELACQSTKRNKPWWRFW